MDATALAHDVIQAAASEWNAVHRLKGDDRVFPERSQYNEGRDFDGAIIVEWTVFPGSTFPPQSARVTAIDTANLDSYRDVESQVEDEDPDVVILFI